MATSFKCSENAVVKIESMTQVSGETKNDFTNEVTYIVIAQDGSVQDYTVKVTVAPEMDKTIKAFKFEQLKPVVTGRKDEKTCVINVIVPYKTDVTKLVPTITIPDNTEVIPESGKVCDFSEPLKFKVKASDGTSREYTVNVKKAFNAAKSITSFSFPGFNPTVEGRINERLKTITLTVPYGTDVASLKASFTASKDSCVKIGEVVQVSGETANDFTKPVTYTVIAQNDTAQNYVVNVAAAPNSEKMIKEFGFLAPKAAGIIDEAAKKYKRGSTLWHRRDKACSSIQLL